MAKNYNREKDEKTDGGNSSLNPIPNPIPIPEPNVEKAKATSISFEKLEVVKLSTRQKVLGYSFIMIAIVMLLSYIVPDKYYNRDFNIVLLNVELFIVFARDIYLYFKKSCKLARTIMCLMCGIYILNCLDIFFQFRHYAYLEISAILIIIALGILSITNKNG